MRPDRDNVQGCLLGLFLLSTGEDKFLTNVKRQVRAMAAKDAKPQSAPAITFSRPTIVANRNRR